MNKQVRFLTLLALLCLMAIGASAEVGFSELMASNGVYEEGHAYDWVELVNNSSQSVDLSGYGLSDKEGRPFLYQFPQGTKLKAGQLLVVNCIDDTVDPPDSRRHYAPFKLSSEGESLFLSDASGSLLERLDFPFQYGNVSFGLLDGQWRYLETATPGKQNRGPGFDRQSAAPMLSPGGFYEGGVVVTITAQPGAVIRYTLDGSEPGAKSARYQKPIRFQKTGVLRARAFVEGELPSADKAASYFINDGAPCPVVSLVGDERYLFDDRIGALVKGKGSIPNYEKELEYPIHIEYFDEKGQAQISQRGTFTASGHSARINAQKSIALYARSAYGPDRFHYNPFPNRDYMSYKSLLLRSANSDANSTRLRDPVISSAAEGLGLLYQDARPILVYVNGRYWGHYNLREKINKHFVAQWEGLTKDKDIDRIDILARTGIDAYVQNGSNRDWLELMDFCLKNDLNRPENLAYVTERLDVDSLFRHSLFEMIVGNYDMTNVRMYRVPGGKWKYLLFDVEAGFMGLKEEPISWYIKPKTANRARFQHVHLSALLEVPQMRARFLELFGEMLEKNFLWTQMESRYQLWEDALMPLLPRHFQRWKGLNEKNWRANVNASKYYARVRPLKVVDLLCKAMKVTKEERALYLGRAEELLKQYNSR